MIKADFLALLIIFLSAIGSLIWGHIQFKRAQRAEKKLGDKSVDEIQSETRKEIESSSPDQLADLGNDLVKKLSKD